MIRTIYISNYALIKELRLELHAGFTTLTGETGAGKSILLGALGLGDIGVHFPDTSAAYKDIDSKILLAKTYELISAKGYSIVNIDSTLLLQAPKIKPYVPAMQSCIASILHLSTDAVSIKATTTEELSFIGREEGAVATANVLLVKDL